jgi:hypothetical protein
MIQSQMIQPQMKRTHPPINRIPSPPQILIPQQTPKPYQIHHPTGTHRTLHQLHKPLPTVILQQAVILKPHLRQRAITTHRVRVEVIQQLLMIMTPISILIFIRPRLLMIVTGQMIGIVPGQMDLTLLNQLLRL